MKVYISWHEGGWDSSVFFDYVSSSWEKLEQKLKEEYSQPDEIQIYDTETMEQVGYIPREKEPYTYGKEILFKIKKSE